MGRVISYNIKKDSGKNFTRKELEHMRNVSEFYNSDELLNSINKSHKVNLKELWTCENFYLSPDESSLKTNKISNFTKTQGNEFNSMLILKALITISKLVPTATVYVYDEGEYLLCPLHIKKGRALPLIEKVKTAMNSYALRLILSKKSKYNIMSELKNAEGFTEIFEEDLDLNNCYGEMDIKHIDDKLRNLKLVEKVLIDAGITKDGEHKLYHYNIAKRPSNKWFKPEIFARNVIVENFLGYNVSPATLMDGFNGEGFGLTDEDSEKKSYEMLAGINQILGMNDSNNDLKAKILGEN